MNISAGTVGEIRPFFLAKIDILAAKEYTYDALGQLLTERVNGTLVNRMTYDSNGNMLSKNGVRYTYDTVWRDKLIAYGDDKFTYDAQGNPYVYRGHALAWEKGRQLKSFDNIQYTYNANGIRTSKTVGDIRHEYVLDGAKILRETWGENVLVPLYDNEDSVCGIVYNDVPYYFQKNLQGDVIAIVDANAQTVSKYSYDAWGVCTITQDDTACGIATINPYRYRGYYYDAETGLYYLQSRYYDAVVGRFVNADEAEMVNNVNGVLYSNLLCYCYNNSVNYQDYSGYIAIMIGVGVTVSLGTAAALISLTVFGLSYVLDRSFRNAINQLFALLVQRAVDGVGYLSNVISEIVCKAKQARKYFGYEEHHIVAQSDRRAASTRDFISQYGIYTWQPYNLVTIKKTLHRHLHTNAYHAAVELVLRSCAYRQYTFYGRKYAIIAGLVLIGALLKAAGGIF